MNATHNVPRPHANGSSAKYIESLENRLARMEHLLRLSGKAFLISVEYI